MTRRATARKPETKIGYRGKMMAYYNTDAPEVIKAWNEFIAECEIVKQVSKEFAEKFEGAEPLISSDIHSGYQFYGLKFSPKADTRIWTKPDQKTGLEQRPRSSVQAGIKGEDRKILKIELDALNEKWKAGRPSRKASLDKFLNLIGAGGGALFFSNYSQRFVDGVFYFSTSVKLSELTVEILGSEFDAADKKLSEK